MNLPGYRSLVSNSVTIHVPSHKNISFCFKKNYFINMIICHWSGTENVTPFGIGDPHPDLP
ncbi:hypothetical protein Lalb_Chr18g0054011 [Lupinus albus]|uniref:Uncharacterized protein n=1 Tax=Lupinus albus TaxID=3870 RepID=A0A6A4P5R8_LUPAL|nr:hypothetical protein Lalb_Chr18g0054011 [Lupinus albus]